jgi:hypothetical protein
MDRERGAGMPWWRSDRPTCVLAGFERRASVMARTMSSALHWMRTPSCSEASDGPASGSNLVQTMAAKRRHASQMAKACFADGDELDAPPAMFYGG